VLDERALHGVQLAAAAQALDGADLAALTGDRQGEAREDGPAVDDDRAGAAGALVAALLRTGQVEMLAEGVEETHPRFEVDEVGDTVDRQGHGRPRGAADDRRDIGGLRRPVPCNVCVHVPVLNAVPEPRGWSASAGRPEGSAYVRSRRQRDSDRSRCPSPIVGGTAAPHGPRDADSGKAPRPRNGEKTTCSAVHAGRLQPAQNCRRAYPGRHYP
jgi:hypothetical protein